MENIAKGRGNMKKSAKITIYSILCGIFLVALVLGSIFDLEISKNMADITPRVYYSQNPFATIFETFGESIVYVLCVVALAILFFKVRKTAFRKRYIKWIIAIFLLILSMAIATYGILKVIHYLKIHSDLKGFLATNTSKLLIVVAVMCVLVAVYSLTSLISDDNLDRLYKWAIAVLVVSALSNGITQVSKYIFRRTRFRAMVYEGYMDYEYYTPWFVINTKKFASISNFASDYFKSFPSGHSCAAASTFLLLLLPAFCPKLNTKSFKISATILCTTYTACVMLSRIIAGAHFLTDTLIGSGITIACIIAYYFAIVRNKKAKYLCA